MATPAERYAAARERRTVGLDRFEAGYDFPLDPFQRQACLALGAGGGVLLAAPTGAGKTVVGEYAVHRALDEGVKCFYTTPIKALSNQKYHDLVARHGVDRVGLLTGDNSINGEAPVVVMTTEVLRNMLYSGSTTLDDLGYVVMDEVHYLADRFRGAVWEEVIILLPQRIQLVSLSATVSNAEEFGDWLRDVRGRTEVVVDEIRPVPLWQHVMVGTRLLDLFVDDAQEVVNPELVRLSREAHRERRGQDLGPRGRRHRGRDRRTPWRTDVVTELHDDGLLPGITFIFSRAGCDAAVDQCIAAGIRLTDAEERAEIDRVVEHRTSDIPHEDLAALGFETWADGLRRGLAAHHAGMLPRFKEVVEELFQRGLVRMVFATETLALGINMPARTVVLERLVKWNGEAHVTITPGEYTQLTGRAGRRGIDVEGHGVVAWHPDLDPAMLAGLASTRTYPLRSSFRPSYTMAVGLVSRLGRPRARDLLETSFAQFQADRSVVGLTAQVRRNAETLEEYRRRMACHLGNFGEYAALRRQISEREKERSRDAAREERDRVTDSLTTLKPGDIVFTSTGRRSGPVLVLDPGIPPDGGTPRPQVLTLDRQVRRLSVTDFTAAVVVAGRLRVPRAFAARSASARRDLAQRLRDRTRELPRPSRTPRQGSGVDEEVAALRSRMRAHPCHGCADREDHARWAERAQRLESENKGLQRRVEQRTHVVARDFDRICDVLAELGYLRGSGDDTEVTPEGRMLGSLYTERDLLVAEALRTGIWDALDPGGLAAVCSGMVFEARQRDESPRLPGGAVAQAIEDTTTLWRDLGDLERAHGIQSSSEPDWGFARTMHRWASGATLARILADSDLTAGDFVRWTKQVIDLLGQIADLPRDTVGDLAERARTAAGLLDRGVVAYSSLA